MGFFSALGFLTLIPVPQRWMRDLKSSPTYFPLVGALLGVIVWVTYEAAVILAGEATGAVTGVVILALLTRGLHLDGLADTFDALGSGMRGKDALAIMRDPRTGPFGAIAVLCTLLLKGALIYDLPSGEIWRSFILFAAIGRMCALVPLCFFPYARKKGVVTPFLPAGIQVFLRGLVFSLAITVAMGGVAGLVVLCVTLLFCYLFSIFLRRRVGGMTGDTVGATIELAEVIALIGIHLWVV